MIKILFLIHDLGQGGVEKFLSISESNPSIHNLNDMR